MRATDLEAGLSAAGWSFWPEDRPGVFRLDMEAPEGAWPTFLQAREDADDLVVYSRMPGSVPPDRIARVCDFATRINRGLVSVTIEVDPDDGEVRLRSALVLGGTGLLRPQLDALLDRNLATMRRVLPALRALAEGEADVPAALAMAGRPVG